MAAQASDIRTQVIRAYLSLDQPDAGLARSIRELELDGETLDGAGYPTELDAAVGAVLLRPGLRSVADPPIHLFTINWADGWHAQWPTTYRVSRVAEFRCAVVTASGDSEAYGFRDFAIGHFGLPADLKAGASRIIIDHWHERAEDGQSLFEEFWEVGLVSRDEALSWATQVNWFKVD